VTRGKGECTIGSVGMILPTTVGRKPRRARQVRPLVMLPDAPGLSHTLCPPIRVTSVCD
jgi:hypothetical protein